VKILHVTPSFHPAYVYGGPTRSVYELCSALADSGCEVKVLTTDANGSNAVLDVDTSQEVTLREGLSVRYCHRIMDVSVSPALLKALGGYISRCDVVHLTAVYSFPTIPVLAVCKTLGKPIVWSPRGMLQRWRGTSRPWLKTVWERVCKSVSPKDMVLHFTSEGEQRQSLARFTGFRSVVIPNCINVHSIVPRHNQRKDGAVLNLLYLGRIHPIKGLENLVEACNLLARDTSFGAWRLSIAGDGEATYMSSLRNRILAAGLDAQVAMIGAVSGQAKSDVLANADLLIAPSYNENFGMVVAEALAHGVPVVASTGTPWQRVEEVGCGLWVDNSPCSLAEAIKCAAGMPLSEMGAKGRQWIERDFSGPRVGARMMELYRRLVEETSTGRSETRRNRKLEPLQVEIPTTGGSADCAGREVAVR
jgi:glycosyltransferase involved in cell wall biosynthesis